MYFHWITSHLTHIPSKKIVSTFLARSRSQGHRLNQLFLENFFNCPKCLVHLIKKFILNILVSNFPVPTFKSLSFFHKMSDQCAFSITTTRLFTNAVRRPNLLSNIKGFMLFWEIFQYFWAILNKSKICMYFSPLWNRKNTLEYIFFISK